MPSAFLGAWKLVSLEPRDSNGRLAYPFGENATGMIIYDAGGNMSVQVRPDRPQFASPDFHGGTEIEVRAAFEGYIKNPEGPDPDVSMDLLCVDRHVCVDGCMIRLMLLYDSKPEDEIDVEEITNR